MVKTSFGVCVRRLMNYALNVSKCSKVTHHGASRSNAASNTSADHDVDYV